MAEPAAPLRILHLEDVITDSNLVERELRKAGIVFDFRQVATRNEFVRALADFRPNIILCDYNVPGFDGLSAVHLVRRDDTETPVILVTGALSDMAAVEIVYAGADEYVLKDHLARLPLAISRVLELRNERHARVAAEEALRDSELRYRRLFETALDGISIVDAKGGAIVEANPAISKLLGYSRSELVGKVLKAFQPAEAVTIKEASVPKASSLRKKDGTIVLVEILANYFSIGDNTLIQYNIRDITERKTAEERVLYLARYDGLTGLRNRADFVERLQDAIVRTERGGKGFAVLYLDLDHFKDINDTLGHPTGDVFLQCMGKRLQASIRKADTVARFGGDEFALIETDIAGPQDAALLADNLVKAASEPISIQGNEIQSGASVGIAVYGSDSADAETLLSHADVALYRAKSDGRGTYRFFTNAMDAAVRQRVALSKELREAVASGQFFLMYQPQVEIATGRIVGLEALVRWQHPTRGIVGPGLFIPVTEQTGLILPLGRWVTREACRQTKQWLDAGIATPLTAVNLSGAQFRTAQVLEKELLAILAEFGLPPTLLELELTESVLMELSGKNKEVMIRLQKVGIRFAIDDFGTGYSSLDYLRRLPVNRIKIAQSFIVDLDTVPENGPIVRAALALAKELGLEVIIEGVETPEQVKMLQAWGGRVAQGYYFSKPLLPVDLEPLLRRGWILRSAISAKTAA